MRWPFLGPRTRPLDGGGGALSTSGATDFSGFFPPLDNPPTLNLVKAGSATPVKFSRNGDQGLDIFAAGYPKSEQIACSSTAEVDGIESTMTAGLSSLPYEASSDQYTYVWKSSPRLRKVGVDAEATQPEASRCG